MSATILPPIPGVATRLVLFWVQVYTLGLPEPSRERRTGQIRSDLWEHYSDLSGQGTSPGLIGLEALGRAARGAVADLFWRLQLEGPQVQINIPIERIAGACLILLVGALILSTNVSGYDPNVEGFDGELRRLAGIKGWQVGIYTALQVLSGIAMLAGAVVLYMTLKRYSTTSVILAVVALAAAGMLTLITSAFYSTAADLADEYVAATPEHRDAVLTVARAFVLMLSSLVPVTALMLALSVGGFATITARHHLVPGWLRLVGVGSAIALGLAFVAELVVDDDTAAWMLIIVGLLLMLLWLLVAGAWLLLGGSRKTPVEPDSGSAVDLIAPRPVT